MQDFEWDLRKAASNERTHNVSFEEASTVFYDPLAKIFADDDHSQDEVRELIIGWSNRKRLLIVSFTERGERIRLISARKATRRERRKHEEEASEE